MWIKKLVCQVLCRLVKFHTQTETSTHGDNALRYYKMATATNIE